MPQLAKYTHMFCRATQAIRQRRGQETIGTCWLTRSLKEMDTCGQQCPSESWTHDRLPTKSLREMDTNWPSLIDTPVVSNMRVSPCASTRVVCAYPGAHIPNARIPMRRSDIV